MSFLEPLELPQPKVGPALIVGAASPLWGYFGAAALGGVAYWWMTRWTEVMNLEALYAAWSPATPAEAAPVTPAAVEAAAELAPPLGGEAAPVSPVVAAVAAAEPAPAIGRRRPPSLRRSRNLPSRRSRGAPPRPRLTPDLAACRGAP